MTNAKKSNNTKSKIDTIAKLALIIASTALIFSLSWFIWLASYMSLPIHEQEAKNKTEQFLNLHQLSWCYDNDVKPCHIGDPDYWGENGTYTKLMAEIEDQKWKESNGEN